MNYVIIQCLSVSYVLISAHARRQTVTPSAQNEVCPTRGTGVGHPPRAPPSEGWPAGRATFAGDRTRRAFRLSIHEGSL